MGEAVEGGRASSRCQEVGEAVKQALGGRQWRGQVWGTGS